jgi:hypothetical protein
LASPRSDARRIPRLGEVLRQIGKSIRIDFDLGLLDGSALLQIADAAERGLPILLQLGGDKTIVRIARGIPALGQTRLVSRLPQFQVQNPLLFFLCIRSALNAASIAIGSTARSSSLAIAESIRGPPNVMHRGRPIIRFGLSQRYTGRLCGLPV